MGLNEPNWWYDDAHWSLVARSLWPVGSVYGAIAKHRFRYQNSYRSRLPVICVGNFTAGGTGKTPLALHICQELIASGQHPVFLTRGFKGREKGPMWVDPERHTAVDVGDEPLLLARAAPTLISVHRGEGAKFIESGGRRANVIIMDDGLQNPQLAKDLTIGVIDGRRGFGNGGVIPAGPLRAPLAFQLALTDAIVINNRGGENTEAVQDPTRNGLAAKVRRVFSGPILGANAMPREDTSWLAQTPIVAFAGIANPDRFFDMLGTGGAHLAVRRAFPDHHVFSEHDAKLLLKTAFDVGARLVTTEKDWVRLSGLGEACGELQTATVPFAIRLGFSAKDDIRFDEMLKSIENRLPTR